MLLLLRKQVWNVGGRLVMKSFSEIIEELPEDEREIVLKEARQSAKTQQKKNNLVSTRTI